MGREGLWAEGKKGESFNLIGRVFLAEKLKRVTSFFFILSIIKWVECFGEFFKVQFLKVRQNTPKPSAHSTLEFLKLENFSLLRKINRNATLETILFFSLLNSWSKSYNKGNNMENFPKLIPKLLGFGSMKKTNSCKVGRLSSLPLTSPPSYPLLTYVAPTLLFEGVSSSWHVWLHSIIISDVYMLVSCAMYVPVSMPRSSWLPVKTLKHITKLTKVINQSKTLPSLMLIN